MADAPDISPFTPSNPGNDLSNQGRVQDSLELKFLADFVGRRIGDSHLQKREPGMTQRVLFAAFTLVCVRGAPVGAIQPRR